MKKFLAFILVAVTTIAFMVSSVGQAFASTTVTVSKGDTLWGISQKFNVSVKSIKNSNNLENNIIKVGQKLRVLSKHDGKKAHHTGLVDKEVVTRKEVSDKVQPVVNTYNRKASVATAEKVAKAADQGSPKAWIAFHESRGSYSVTNGKYIGRYQLDAAYLHGDFSPENQEKVANKYVSDRYGSWQNAKQFWQSHGWY
ncbi:LysM peptidoglycan-binding domain-containing protein [Lentilactobacillus sp. Marseille-Q4993]|uniref:aggregation-promoting factor n=1 Tax=Lentilactobacillus sp. Marseille-Q4993 TaxID=3039492 RepID=UPI0024BD4A1B|nr:LysM peptidoglycan-binding domain-containing protein [Lentilactobacillus sp. Marseille-Q4993]